MLREAYPKILSSSIFGQNSETPLLESRAERRDSARECRAYADAYLRLLRAEFPNLLFLPVSSGSVIVLLLGSLLQMGITYPKHYIKPKVTGWKSLSTGCG